MPRRHANNGRFWAIIEWFGAAGGDRLYDQHPGDSAMKHTHLALLAAGVVAVLSLPARAQVPFVGAGAAIFDPEIGVVQSGVILDAQAVVSADRKYVTM